MTIFQGHGIDDAIILKEHIQEMFIKAGRLTCTYQKKGTLENYIQINDEKKKLHVKLKTCQVFIKSCI